MRLSRAMKRVMVNLYEGREPFGHISGRAMHGGAGHTRLALAKRGIWNWGEEGLSPTGYRLAEEAMREEKEKRDRMVEEAVRMALIAIRR